MKKLLPFLFLSLALCACESRQERMSKVWFFDVADFSSEDTGTDYLADQANPMNLSHESFLSLQHDGKYTSYFGHYNEGQWRIRGSDLVLTPASGIDQIFKIKYVGKKMKLYYPVRSVQYTFDGVSGSTDKDGDSPFTHQNNQWRIKPTHKESDAELHRRLLNHFHFWEAYFNWAAKNKLQVLNVNELASPLRIYANGFELIPFSDEPYDWKAHFYDNEDAQKAFELMRQFVGHGHIKWEHADERFVMFASAFRQLQQNMSQFSL